MRPISSASPRRRELLAHIGIEVQVAPVAIDERLADLLRQGLWLEAQAGLTAQGHRPGLVNEFLSDLAALPSVIIVPQTTAMPLSPAAPAGEEEG